MENGILEMKVTENCAKCKRKTKALLYMKKTPDGSPSKAKEYPDKSNIIWKTYHCKACGHKFAESVRDMEEISEIINKNKFRTIERIYNEGKWLEVTRLVEQALPYLTDKEDIAQAKTIKAWSLYYMGIKCPAGIKEKILDQAREDFFSALGQLSNRGKRLSVLNGLALVLWILKHRESARKINRQALISYPDDPSALNTLAILHRWNGDYEESLKICDKAYENAAANMDLKTVGKIKQNKAEALRAIGQTEHARMEYSSAISFYKRFEKTSGQSAKFHIEEVKRILNNH